MVVWFLGELRADVQSVLTHTAKPRIGTGTTTKAPRDLIVAALINPWDEDITLDLDPVAGNIYHILCEINTHCTYRQSRSQSQQS